MLAKPRENASRDTAVLSCAMSRRDLSFWPQKSGSSIFCWPLENLPGAMLALVVVHMSGCPYCVEVTGEGSMAKSVADLVPVYEVERSDPLVQQLHVKSFPTIFLSSDDATFRFEGRRSPERLRRFVLEKMKQLKEHHQKK
jgi:hypothetical protein